MAILGERLNHSNYTIKVLFLRFIFALDFKNFTQNMVHFSNTILKLDYKTLKSAK